MTGRRLLATLAWAALGLGQNACGDDDGGTQADRYGVGAECAQDDDCFQSDQEGEISQSCLRQFKGGYCGVESCTSDDDCPEGSACVRHEDQRNYCFRICIDKPECNRNRSLENESNCSSNIDLTSSSKGSKACVPPSSG